MEPTTQLVRDFGIALFIGALVGIDREKHRTADPEGSTGGLRTFILYAEAGALSAWLSSQLGSVWIFAVAGALVMAGVIAGYVIQRRTSGLALGLTSETAALIVFLLGGTTLFGYPQVAVMLAIATSAVLAYKEPLHGFVERIGRDDLFAAVKLLAASFIVLPLLPDSPIDPWGALNPYRMWWLVILISSLSLAGYVATRSLGTRYGTPLTGLAGGLVSSTAVTLDFARRSGDRGGRGRLDALACGVLLAWGVMFVRVLIEVAVVNRAILRPLAWPMGALAMVAAVTAFVYHRRAADEEAEERDVPLENPFSLTAAIKFAALFAAVTLVVELVRRNFPGRGIYAVAALAGLTDVDAITLSMAQQARSGDPAVAVTAITIAALSNTATKCGMVLALAAPGLKRRIGIAGALLLVAAVASLALFSR